MRIVGFKPAATNLAIEGHDVRWLDVADTGTPCAAAPEILACRALQGMGGPSSPEITRSRGPVAVPAHQRTKAMHANSHLVPATRGIQCVTAETPAAAQVAAAIADFRTAFESHRDNADGRIHDIEANLRELEQRLADGYSPGEVSGRVGRSPGAVLAQHLTKDAAFTDVANKRSKSTSVDVDASMFLGNVEASTTTTDGGGLAVRQNVGVAGVVERKRFVRQRFRNLPALGGSIEYSRESWTNNASEQGGGSPLVYEGVQKNETDISFTLVDEKIRTVAHWCKASRQILSDVAGLQQVLENRLLHGLELRLETSILAGTGSGAQQKGLFHADNRVAYTPASGYNAIDNVSAALGIAANSYEIMPDLLLLNPIDYRSMQRTKAVDSGVYLWGGPGSGQGADTASCWEVPIHASPAVPQGNFGVTEVAQMGFLAIRSDARAEVGLDGNDFTSNLVTLLAELRATLIIERPTATLYGSLTT